MALTSSEKWWASLLVVLLAALVFSKFFMFAMNSVFSVLGLDLMNGYGCSNMAGYIIQLVIFFLLVRLLMV